MHLPRYQDNLKMKEARYEVIGYTRKLTGEKDDMKRTCLLNLTVKKPKTRSLADRVFVSPNSSASNPFNKREEKKKTDVSHNCKWRHTQGKERICHFC
ncbi:hypothetical protein BD770DRAFT_398986 [Pilaira anomala]|nr:hypothetical protein BD770DRAFT_398986 [Pilaira anomala]